MSPSTLTYERHEYSEATTAEQRIIPLQSAYLHGMGHIVENRFQDLVRDGADPGTIYYGLSSALNVLDHNPNINGVNHHEDRVLDIISKITGELSSSEEIREGVNQRKLFHSLLGTISVLDRRFEHEKRASLVNDLIPLVGNLARKGIQDEAPGGIGESDIWAFEKVPLREETKEKVLATLRYDKVVPEEDSHEGHPPPQLEEEVSFENFDTSALSSARSLEELQQAYLEHQLSGTIELAQKYNEILEQRILDMNTKFGDSLRYFKNRIPIEQDSLGNEEALHLALDEKLLARAQEFSFSHAHKLLSKLLENYQLLTDPENENYESLIARFNNYQVDAFSGLLKTAAPGDIVGSGPRRVSLSELQQTSIDSSIKLERDYSKVSLDTETLLNNPDAPKELKKIYELSETKDPEDTKRLFIESVKYEMGSPNNFGIVYRLSELRNYVDDPSLRQEIASIRDRQLITLVQGLYQKNEFQHVVKLLEAVPFISDDQDQIAAAKSYYAESVTKLTEQDK